MSQTFMSDRRIIYCAVLVRSMATGMIGVLFGIYLAERSLSASTVSLIVGAGLGGAALASLLVTLCADRIGHRRALIVIALLSCVGALMLGLSAGPWALAFAAFIGMVNGMGRDRGAALVIEQATLPSTVPDRERTMAFAKYNVLQDIGHAAGSLLAGMPMLLQHVGVAEPSTAFRASILTYAALSLLPAFVYARLSQAIETPRLSRRQPVSLESKRILWKISSLFALDSLGGGFLTTAFLSYFFRERFGVGIDTIGVLFFLARMANAASHFGAAYLARRIGLVNTMVFTHIPSSLLLVTVPFMPNFWIAAALFVVREGLVEMDVPTRQSYVMAVVRPDERTFASGVTHLVRLGGWALAPLIAGLLIAKGSLVVPLIVGAAMKVAYDLALWYSFRHLRPPEELR